MKRQLLITAVILLGLSTLSSCGAPPPASDVQLHPFLTCVRRHESDRGPHPHTNGYAAQNPSSSASGAYQFIDSTWRKVSSAAGHPGTARAAQASPRVQDLVAYDVAVTKGNRSPWKGTGC